ncbi:MAG: carbohydrate kinase [Chloroflexi bacterium]|nr:MAG: carbohydrate kinase [Chloroflexota bacterium]
MSYVLGIDQGSSGSRALLLDREGRPCGYGYAPVYSLTSRPDYVEQRPEDVLGSVLHAVHRAMEESSVKPRQIVACGIACQRNTEFVWDAVSGLTLANAISWQDMRTLPLLEEAARLPFFHQAAQVLGYPPGPYSAALHLAWRMRHQPEVAAAAQAGRLRVGLSAEYIVHALGRLYEHAMDASLVQALGLFDFRQFTYWDEWVNWVGVPQEALPAPKPTIHQFGELHLESATIPVVAMIGDQQAALFGHGAHHRGQAKCTHGTASFVNVFTGEEVQMVQGIHTYFAWSVNGSWTYCLEADTTVTGAAIRWLHTKASLLADEREIDVLASSVPDSGGVVFVPAFTGLNVPYHDRRAQAAVLGLSFSSTRAHVARALLESIGFQVRAILDTITSNTDIIVPCLAVDGGIARSDIACQVLADLTGLEVVRPDFTELTAWAAALLAGIAAGLWTFDQLPPTPGGQTVFRPAMSRAAREAAYARWNAAVQAVRLFGSQAGFSNT